MKRMIGIWLLVIGLVTLVAGSGMLLAQATKPNVVDLRTPASAVFKFFGFGPSGFILPALGTGLSYDPIGNVINTTAGPAPLTTEDEFFTIGPGQQTLSTSFAPVIGPNAPKILVFRNGVKLREGDAFDYGRNGANFNSSGGAPWSQGDLIEVVYSH